MSTKIYRTIRVSSTGKPLAGTFERKYRANSEAQAAELAASNSLTVNEYSAASSSYNEDGVWTFTPGTGSPVHISVTELPEEAPAPEPAAVVARDERLHPVTHPYRHGEVVEYVGPRTRGGLVPGVARYQHLMEPGVAVLRVGEMFHTAEVADLRRPEANVNVELTPQDVARIFQALSVEVERLSDFRAGDPDQVMRHALELRNRFAALHP